MADYDALDDATLQQMLSEATSYEERAALRHALRNRKKERGEATARSKPRGNSVYNRFAGSTATKTGAKGRATNPLPPCKPNQGVVGSSTSPTPKKVSASPVQQHTVSTPTPPPSPISPVSSQEPSKSQEPEETDGTPVTVEPVEDEGINGAQQDDADTPEEEVKHEELEEKQEEKVDDEPDSSAVVEVAPAGHELHSLFTAGSAEAPQQENRKQPSSMESKESSGDFHGYLVAYVNQALFLDPPLPSRGRALYDTCCDPTLLCKLINKSVSGTVDLRALSKVTGSSAQRAEAIEDNMTLVIESARAIGCQINDLTQNLILQKDPETIDNFLIDLIRARVVHMPGMEDEPASTFTDIHVLFQKLNISVDDGQDSSSVSWRDSPEKVRKALHTTSPPSKGGSWKEGSTDLTYEERAARRKAEREQRQKEKEAGENTVELTYEERAAQRRAERERRRREREALAK